MEGTNPLTMLEWLTDSSLPLRRDLDLENTKILPEVIKLHSRQWLGHYSSLHHIHHIVIFDLDMLRLVMEHWVLRKLHRTLVFTIYTSSIQLEIK